MSNFDYSVPAELFRRRTNGKSARRYFRFDTAAAAISFAIEELDGLDLLWTTLEVDEQRVDSRAIRDLYDAQDYPLPRKMVTQCRD